MVWSRITLNTVQVTTQQNDYLTQKVIYKIKKP
jgi:hypothetical protein